MLLLVLLAFTFLLFVLLAHSSLVHVFFTPLALLFGHASRVALLISILKFILFTLFVLHFVLFSVLSSSYLSIVLSLSQEVVVVLGLLVRPSPLTHHLCSCVLSLPLSQSFRATPLISVSNLGHFSYEGSVLVLVRVLLCRTHINLSARMPLSISLEYPASVAASSKPNRLFFCAFPILPLKFCIAPFWCPLLYCLPLSITVTLCLCSRLWLSLFHFSVHLAFSLPVSACVSWLLSCFSSYLCLVPDTLNI